jgi:hypothetical protein
MLPTIKDGNSSPCNLAETELVLMAMTPMINTARSTAIIE